MHYRFECPLCNEGVSGGMMVTSCRHLFHQECFLEHYFKKTSKTCPECDEAIDILQLCMCVEGRYNPHLFATWRNDISTCPIWDVAEEEIVACKFPKKAQSWGFNVIDTETATRSGEKSKTHCRVCEEMIERKFMMGTQCGHFSHLECFQKAHFSSPTKKCPHCYEPTTELNLYFFDEVIQKWLWAATFPAGIAGKSHWMTPNLAFNVSNGITSHFENIKKYVCTWERAVDENGRVVSEFFAKGFDRCKICDYYLVKDEEIFEMKSSDKDTIELIHARCAKGKGMKVSDTYKYFLESGARMPVETHAREREEGILKIDDLPFELIEMIAQYLDPKDVSELMMTNKRLDSFYSMDQSIVFGEHVSSIELYDEMICIQKFSDSDQMQLNFDRFISHFSFVKKIRSCDSLTFQMKQFNDKCTFLSNLESVNRLALEEWRSKEALEKFFSIFQASIKEEAVLDMESRDYRRWLFLEDRVELRYEIGLYEKEDEENQVLQELIENTIMARLKDCENIEIYSSYCDGYGQFDDFYNDLLTQISKTQIKKIYIFARHWGLDMMAQHIVTNGIPSKNPEAAIYIYADHDYALDLSQYPEMRRIDGENRLRFLEQANRILENLGVDSDNSMEEILLYSLFRRRIDSTKDCIYVYRDRPECFFLAFYVPAD